MDRNSLRQVREAKMLSKTGQTRRNLSVDAGPDWMIRVLDYADKGVVYGAARPTRKREFSDCIWSYFLPFISDNHINYIGSFF